MHIEKLKFGVVLEIKMGGGRGQQKIYQVHPPTFVNGIALMGNKVDILPGKTSVKDDKFRRQNSQWGEFRIRGAELRLRGGGGIHNVGGGNSECGGVRGNSECGGGGYTKCGGQKIGKNSQCVRGGGVAE